MIKRAGFALAFAALLLSPALADNNSLQVEASSQIVGLTFVPLDKLPPHRGAIEGREDCATFIIAPASKAGKQVAAAGWAVTAEEKAGDFQAVSFAGKFVPGTSGTCAVEEGNVALFKSGQLVALAYAPHGSKLSIGRIVALENVGVRVWDGELLSHPVGDINLLAKGPLQLTAPAKEESVCGGKARVPFIYNMPIDKARETLVRQGWKPVATAARSNGDESGTVSDLIKKGFAEIDDCSGTGMGYCSFNYSSAAGRLNVVTAGEDELPSVTTYDVNCQ